jgi:hypothetical protein
MDEFDKKIADQFFFFGCLTPNPRRNSSIPVPARWLLCGHSLHFSGKKNHTVQS